MAIDVVLITEEGENIELVFDPENALSYLTPDLEDESFHLLRFIDPYGDTIFNRLQMETFIKEWKRIGSMAESEAEKALVKDVEQLAHRCLAEVHTYLKFIGD
ncbi:hypothetical protein ACFL6Q_02245 [Candidatus Neomarinimicrobiota bacterium]